MNYVRLHVSYKNHKLAEFKENLEGQCGLEIKQLRDEEI